MRPEQPETDPQVVREPLPGCLKQFQSANILTSRRCFGCSGVHCAPGLLCPPGDWSVSSDLVSTSGLPQVCLCHFWWITLNLVLQHPQNSVSFSSSGTKLSFPLKSLPHVLWSQGKWEGFFRTDWCSLRFCGRAAAAGAQRQFPWQWQFLRI